MMEFVVVVVVLLLVGTLKLKGILDMLMDVLKASILEEKISVYIWRVLIEEKG